MLQLTYILYPVDIYPPYGAICLIDCGCRSYISEDFRDLKRDLDRQLVRAIPCNVLLANMMDHRQVGPDLNPATNAYNKSCVISPHGT